MNQNSVTEKAATHTPGPWELRPDPRRSVGIVSVRGVETKPIAYVQFANTDLEDGLANANLIAAAPDLLEAVRAGGRYSDALRRYQDQGVHGQLIPGTDELDRLFMEWHDKGHAALEKAEGRS